ncbi:MAG: trypsin-like peptidase domain-containing protein [Acidobacteria bacterium]|nr:trypsin-like peptidase domain-containing protein [Acidobacteriota bacterium]
MNRRAVAALLFPLVLVGGARAAAGDDASDFRELLERVSPSIVGLKVVLKTEFDFGGSLQDQESTLDARGAVVDPSGLILVWNSQISASRLVEAAQQMGGGEALQLKITPTDFHVTVDGHGKEYRAFLVGQDSDLDVAFLQIEDLLERPLPAIDFEKVGTARLGEEVVGVSRLSPRFDGAPYFETGRIAGEVRKPRRAWVLDASPALLGLPVFNLRGEPVGVVATVLSKVAESGPSGADMMGFFALGRGGVESGPLGLFLLPAERIRGVVREAKKRAATLLAERLEEKKAS